MIEVIVFSVVFSVICGVTAEVPATMLTRMETYFLMCWPRKDREHRMGLETSQTFPHDSIKSETSNDHWT